MPADQIVGMARKRASASDKIFNAAKEMADNVYPLIEELAKHVEAIEDVLQQDEEEAWIPKEVSEQILSLIASLTKERTLTDDEKKQIALVTAAITELTPDDEEEEEEDDDGE